MTVDIGRERRANPLTALAMLTFSEDDDEAVAHQVRRLVTEQCSFRLSGTDLGVDGYLDHIRALRAGMVDGELQVVIEVADDGAIPRRCAGRYLVRMRMHDGTVIRGEAHLIGTLDNEHRITEFFEIGQVIGGADNIHSAD